LQAPYNFLHTANASRLAIGEFTEYKNNASGNYDLYAELI
jgi:hypothetical protein